MYEIEVKKKIVKFVNDLQNSNLIWSKIKELKNFKSNKRLQLDIERMKGKYKNSYRLRIGEIRFIFEILPEKIILKSADYRGRAYK